MKKLTLIGVLATLCLFVKAQQPALKPLTIGDTVPDIFFSQVLNYKDTTAKLSDFKGKLVLLDFWATWCGSCLESMPEMEKFQEKYPNDLQVLMINDQRDPDNEKEMIKKETIKNFFEKRKQRTGIDMPLTIIAGDTTLSTFFPHKGIPHIIWIDRTGKFVSVTFPESVTDKNIQMVLNGKGNPPVTKKDNLLYDRDSPLFMGNNISGDPSSVLYRSTLTGPLENIGARGGIVISDSGCVTKLYKINSPLLSLFSTAYAKIFDIGNTSAKIIVEAPGLNLKQIYCYELITPCRSKKEVFKYMQDDLYRYFHVLAKKEIRPVSCYVVIANNNLPKSYTRHKTASKDTEVNSLKKYMYNQSIDYFLNWFCSALDKPFFNETGIEHNIDIDLPYDIYKYSVEEMKKFLFDKGFTILEKTKDMEVAVITYSHPDETPETITKK